MWGRDHPDEQLEEFIAARTQDLHHDAYQLTAAQQPAEQLVIAVLADMRRERVEMAQAGTAARLRMARIAARLDAPSEITDVSQLPSEFRVLARLSPRQRAVLLLQVVDNYDDRETARELQLSSRATAATLQSIPYDELPGASPHSGELRSLLEAFGDLAASPSATTTLADVHAVPPPPRRPWWVYVAVFVVIVLTIASLVITQSWHNDWLRSPEGLNHTHGTHFPAYTQGYKLVAIHDVAPGPAEDIAVGASGALALECHPGDRTVSIAVSSDITGTFSQNECGVDADGPNLTPARGTALVSISNFNHDTWPIAIYRKVPWRDYPVATGRFVVGHPKTLDEARRQTDGSGHRIPPVAAGTVLTMQGTAERPNGTFTGQLDIPASVGLTELDVIGLISPTTTGRFRVRLNGEAPWVSCASFTIARYTQQHPDDWCALYDRHIPQVDFSTVDPSWSVRSRRVTVELSVQHARGPWSLQVAADRYKRDAGAVDDGANG
ncbi:hypothetical protein GCM10011492_06770 [Flexivirga endophytica]|uniref:RNA polymerase sigma factor 70 region 4 type 2 domain-containing protein n=1 Tax=Flexivirga endophytica TaxID=1849103 RepID=A0A916SY44_9MICO|nr:sigma factor-like helix-turn-helix DNA-binding protein [Flexivirga endophytica]GGB19563.1 hypothetical protein GCM10011492_06770 [Flexivirga endophytica]GHB36129.1 hypothetical protein GCM10008112_00840 [Flexivirga endophytica]